MTMGNLKRNIRKYTSDILVKLESNIYRDGSFLDCLRVLFHQGDDLLQLDLDPQPLSS